MLTPSVTTYATPRKLSIVPRVEINGCNFSFVTKIPFRHPAAHPINNPTKREAIGSQPEVVILAIATMTTTKPKEIRQREIRKPKETQTQVEFNFRWQRRRNCRCG